MEATARFERALSRVKVYRIALVLRRYVRRVSPPRFLCVGRECDRRAVGFGHFTRCDFARIVPRSGEGELVPRFARKFVDYNCNAFLQTRLAVLRI